MNDTQALKILQEILNKYALTNQEKTAIRSAIGMLGWTSLAERNIKAMGKRVREKYIKDSTWEEK